MNEDMNDFIAHPALTGTVIRRSFLLIGLLLVSSCAGAGSTVQRPSENYNSRVSIIVIHHTSENFEDSLNILTLASSRPVSSHYLVPEPADPTYPHKKLKLFELVPETERAWHAGQSYWDGKTALNDQSIGIELVNVTYCHQLETETNVLNAAPNAVPDAVPDAVPEIVPENSEPPVRLCFYPDFAESQIELLIDLLAEIRKRHPDIRPTNIVGHADIAPGRRIDPGPRFPWQRLYQLGFGAWYDDETLKQYWERFIETPMPLINVQKALQAYGYNIEVTGELDLQTQMVLRAFQMHFRPSDISEEPTPESVAVLYALIDKYRPEELDELLFVAPQTEDTEECDCEHEAESGTGAPKH